MIKSHAEQSAHDRGKKHEAIDGDGHFIKDVARKGICGRLSQHGIDRRAGEKPHDDGGKSADKDFGRKALMRFLEGERHARQRGVERDRKPRTRAARNLIPPHHLVSAEHARDAVAAGAADLHAGTFAARGKAHENA